VLRLQAFSRRLQFIALARCAQNCAHLAAKSLRAFSGAGHRCRSVPGGRSEFLRARPNPLLACPPQSIGFRV
jgi:hypothetical protein